MQHSHGKSTQNFHRGEKQIQTEEGVDVDAFEQGVAEPFRPELHPREVRFVNDRTFGVAATVDGAGRPWATPLVGRAGELFTVIDPTTIRIRHGLQRSDPLLADVAATGDLGVLFFDPAQRRRSKSLGQGTVESDGSITYRMHRNFGVCNKYIFKRDHEPSVPAATTAPSGNPVGERPELDADDTALLVRADTTFFASHHEDHGADGTHRGGPAGFVFVEDATTVVMPDYPGNGMFNTLGNLLLDDRLGLLAMDFAAGEFVQLTGRAEVVRSPADDQMSTRTVRLNVESVRRVSRDLGNWHDVEAFPTRPGLYNPVTPYLPGRSPLGVG